MVFVYIRIYFAARARARRAVKKPPKKKKAQPLASIEVEESALPGPATPTVKAPPPTATITTSFSKKPPSSGPPTPDGRKTVGFMEPLSTTTEEKPTIRVHSSSSPE